MTQQRRFEGKTVLVTGSAGPGLGFSTVKLFAEEGAHVAISDRSARRVKEAAERIRTEVDGLAGVTEITLDVTDEESVREGVAGIVAETGSIDVLVNNAAFAEQAALVDMSLESWQRVLNVGLTGPFLMMRACLPHMYAQGSGSVVNVSSIEAWAAADPHIGSYVAAKSGLLGLTRVGAAEAGPHGVRVNAVAPGLMVNKAVEELFDKDALADIVARTPLGRAGGPDEVARTILYLASEDAAFVTGDVLTVAGGLYYHA
ncbi:SDR family oxidoreductase [Arthrobacter sp. I2-34]|uniref:SDR family oxidoreductase n=1 Tax=Arthrobacter hankyongi TaxID=2904801 RepID=A0ABS9L3M4_9MICC|nr:SDR family NAD(P)-dependent oxidoreductase [Arthrobacter hankyongi]MCG2621215.1 SDR family oxidoreductase [Arthrobacter hankyongi]